MRNNNWTQVEVSHRPNPSDRNSWPQLQWRARIHEFHPPNINSSWFEWLVPLPTSLSWLSEFLIFLHILTSVRSAVTTSGIGGRTTLNTDRCRKWRKRKKCIQQQKSVDPLSNRPRQTLLFCPAHKRLEQSIDLNHNISNISSMHLFMWSVWLLVFRTHFMNNYRVFCAN